MRCVLRHVCKYGFRYATKTTIVVGLLVVGEVAYSWSRDTVSVTPSDGTEAIQLAGDALTVWRKRADGGWVLARDACTLLPAARMGRED